MPFAFVLLAAVIPSFHVINTLYPPNGYNFSNGNKNFIYSTYKLSSEF